MTSFLAESYCLTMVNIHAAPHTRERYVAGREMAVYQEIRRPRLRA
jgi:hypothetical protein